MQTILMEVQGDNEKKRKHKNIRKRGDIQVFILAWV